MFWFMLLALVVVVAAVALIALGAADGLPEAVPDRLHHPLPLDRPLARADIDALRLPLALRGYRMAEVDDVLDRVAAELAHRDARIAELEVRLVGCLAEEPEPAKPLREPEPDPREAVPRHHGDGGGAG